MISDSDSVSAHSILSRASNSTNQSQKVEEEKEAPYIGPISLKPTGKEVKRVKAKPLILDKATGADKQFKVMV